MSKKIIRDKYNTIIPKEELSIVQNKVEHLNYLIKKIDEEIKELSNTSFTDINEFADVIEVFYSIAKIKGISIEDIETARIKKNQEKGSFDTGLLLKI